MRVIQSILFILSIIIFASCEKMFDYSPYVIDFDEENTNVNSKNMAKLANQQNDDSVITIAFTGDTHRSFDETDEFVKSVNEINNTKQVDFVIHVGDIADFGLPKQYLWGNSYLLKLNTPYFVVLGNHDLVSNGGDAYLEMFGQYDYSFVYDQVKFIFINTNSLEFDNKGNVPNISWLDQQLQPNSSFRKAVVLFHVAPMHSEFDPNLIDAFNQTLTKYNNVLFVAHGHMHDYSVSSPYNNGITFVNVYSVEHKKFNIIEIENDTIAVETYSF
jgi:Icc-related predicted phosphoesterase